MEPGFLIISGGMKMDARRSATRSCIIGLFVFGLMLELAGLSLADPMDHWHWRNPLPQGNDLNGVAFGNGIFVAVGKSTILTSSDNGATWTIRDAGFSEWYAGGWLTGVTYSNGVFVAVGWGGLIITSSDGINWAKRNSGTNEELDGIGFGNGIFVAVGRGTILTSSDNGATWTARVSGNPYLFSAVAYGNGTFVALCYDFNSKYSKAMTSPDGVTWTERSTGHRWALNSIAFGNGIFVAVGIPDTPEYVDADGVVIMTSPDGISWTGRLTSYVVLHAVAYGNGTFIAVGVAGDILTSPNGVSWTIKNANQYQGFTDSLNGIGYGNGTFVTVGEAGRMLTSPNGVTWTKRVSGFSSGLYGITYANGTYVAVGTRIYSSSDGVAWTERYKSNVSTFFYAVTYGNGLWVAWGGSWKQGEGIVATSSNGITWIERASGATKRLNGVTYGNGKFVAVGNAGTVLTSPDGTSWTSRVSGTSNDLKSVGYGNGLFVAVGSSDTILTSQDGVAWTKRSSGTTSSFNVVTYANGIFVAGGDNIFTSSDGVTWTKRTNFSSYGKWFSGLAYGNGIFAGVGGLFEGFIISSPDGITWAERRSPTSDSLQGVVYGKETFIAVGGNGTILQSDPVIAAPNASVNPASVSFGDINQNSSSDRQVTVGNTGNANLVISGVSSPSSPFSKQSDGCSGQSVPPGGNCTITYRFSPTSAGTFSGSSAITSNDAQKTVNLTGKGIALAPETVSAPSTPTGTGSGKVGNSFSYSTGGSVSSYGHPVQYRFDWKGDGNTDLSPWGSSTQSKTWNNPGTFNVKAQAQCANHPNIVSSWSDVFTVTIASYSYTVDTSPSGLQISVDSTTYAAPQTFHWAANSSHTLYVASPQQRNAWAPEEIWTRYAYSSWSDSGAQSHNVTAPSSDMTYTANFTAQYGLIATTNLDAGGTVNPSGVRWYNNGQAVSIQATANSGYQFCQWSGGATGRSNPVSVNMDFPRQVTANFVPTSPVNGWLGTCPAPVSEDWWFTSLHFPTADEGWAVGEDGSNGKGVLFHYLNDAWTEVSPPPWDSEWGLNGVHFLSANEGWAVGEDYENETGLVMHYLNGNWSTPSTPDIGDWWQLNGVHFTSSSSGWAVGDDYGNGTGMLLRYNGSWSGVEPPDVSSWWWLNSVHFTSSNEGWAVGEDYDNGTGVLLHHISGTWSNTQPPSVSSGWLLNGVHFTSSTDGWAVGEDYENRRGVLLHYNGTWSRVTPPSVSPGWLLKAVRFTSANEGWAVGEDYEAGNGLLLQYSNGNWARVSLPNVSTDWRLESVHFVSPNEGWVVGGDYTSVGILIGYFKTPETVSIPKTPTGPNSGTIGTAYNYSTGDSLSSLQHPVEYRFDWKGDGTDLSPWGSSNQSRTWNSPGSYQVKAMARCKQDTSVMSGWSGVLSVNITSAPVQKPNLAPYQPPGWSDKIVVSKTAGSNTDSSPILTTDTLYVDWSVINNGQVAVSTPFVTRLYVDGTMKKEWTTNSLGVNQHFDTLDFSIGTLDEGTHTVRIVVDAPPGAINESDEGDNEYQKTITVTAGVSDGPDLTGEWVIVPTQACKGTGATQKCKIAGSLKVSNIGNRDAPASFVDFKLKKSGEETLMVRLPAAALKVSGSKVLKLKYNVPAGQTASGKRVEATIDPDNTITEINKGNNVIVWEIP